jgi:hypothetical protein
MVLDVASGWALVDQAPKPSKHSKELPMAKPEPIISIELTAAIRHDGEHYDERDILVVGKDIDDEDARTLIRLGRAKVSDVKRSRFLAREVEKTDGAGSPS